MYRYYHCYSTTALFPAMAPTKVEPSKDVDWSALKFDLFPTAGRPLVPCLTVMS